MFTAYNLPHLRFTFHRSLSRVGPWCAAQLHSTEALPVVGLLLVLAIALGYRLFHITVPLIETFAEREVYDAYLARAFYRDGYTLFNPPIARNLAFGVIENQFALYRFVVALGYYFVGEQILVARLLSVAFALLSVVVLYKIAALSKDRLAGIIGSASP